MLGHPGASPVPAAEPRWNAVTTLPGLHPPLATVSPPCLPGMGGTARVHRSRQPCAWRFAVATGPGCDGTQGGPARENGIWGRASGIQESREVPASWED